MALAIDTASRRPLRQWLLLAASGLAACAAPPTLPGPTPAVDMPAAWSAPASPLRATRERLGDTLLDALVRDALQANTSITSAAASLAQARALSDNAAAALSPSIGGSATAQSSRSGNNPSTRKLQAGLDASWEWDLFGRQRANIDAREADVEATRATLADAQVSVAAEVRLAYVQLRAAQQRLALTQGNLAAQREMLQIAQWRAQAGLGSSLDVEQARAAALQTESQLPQFATSIAQSGHALAVLTGQPPSALQEQLSSAMPIPEADTGPALGVPADLLRQRPDVRAAEGALRAAAARVTQAEAQRLPAFTLNGTIALSGATLGALSGNGAFVSTLLAAVDLPIFDGGARDANVRAQIATLDKARVAYRAAILGALKDVEDALVAITHADNRLVSLQGAADAAANASLLARQRYASGLVDFQTVLETQRSQLNAQDGVATARADIATGHIRLTKALGGSGDSARLETLNRIDRP
jgi:outer membrane protein, multidrug efflux system